MSKEQSNIVEYLVCVIGAFARQFSLTNAKAYMYLRQYKGLDFLTKHYGVEHTQSDCNHTFELLNLKSV